jgi:hypothetical protein
MVGREIVHFSQAGNTLMLIKRGAAIAWVMKSIRVAEGAAPREIAGRTLRPQGE